MLNCGRMMTLLRPRFPPLTRKRPKRGPATTGPWADLLSAHVAKAHRHNCPRWRVWSWKNNARQPILYRSSFALIPAELLVYYECIVRDQAFAGEKRSKARNVVSRVYSTASTSTHHTHTLDSLTPAAPAPSSSPHFHSHARCAFVASRYCPLAFVQEYDFVEALTRTSRPLQTPTHPRTICLDLITHTETCDHSDPLLVITQVV